jgi:hypothetical protein
MIIDKFLDFLASIAVYVIGLFPTWALPTWWSTAVTSWGSIVSGISDLAHWVPLDAVFQVATAVFLVSIFSFTVRIFRIALSLVSGGGGN